MAVDSGEPVIGSSEVKKLEDRVRELGRKTSENEILREALSKAQSKKPISMTPILRDQPEPAPKALRHHCDKVLAG